MAAGERLDWEWGEAGGRRQESRTEAKLLSPKPGIPIGRLKKDPVSALCHQSHLILPIYRPHPPTGYTLLQLYLTYPEVT